jgi:hypothetical protein
MISRWIYTICKMLTHKGVLLSMANSLALGLGVSFRKKGGGDELDE